MYLNASTSVLRPHSTQNTKTPLVLDAILDIIERKYRNINHSIAYASQK